MALATRWVMRLGAAACLSLLLAGCPNPNTYTTPRTAGAGKFTHSIAPEAWGFSVKDGAGSSLSATYPTFPTYTLRIGVADPVDIGLRIANISSLGADIKWNFFRSRAFDAAFDPGAQYFHLSVSASDNSNGASESLGVTYFHVPLLLGFNLSRAVTIVATPGIAYGLASATVSSTSGRDEASGTTGMMARLGVGVDLRVSSGFAVHPEVTALRTFKDPVILYMFGLGFNFGSLPNYDDVDAPAGMPATGVAPSAPPAQAVQ